MGQNCCSSRPKEHQEAAGTLGEDSVSPAPVATGSLLLLGEAGEAVASTAQLPAAATPRNSPRKDWASVGFPGPEPALDETGYQSLSGGAQDREAMKAFVRRIIEQSGGHVVGEEAELELAALAQWHSEGRREATFRLLVDDLKNVAWAQEEVKGGGAKLRKSLTDWYNDDAEHAEGSGSQQPSNIRSLSMWFMNGLRRPDAGHEKTEHHSIDVFRGSTVVLSEQKC
ncbi:unnamed protein product [Polarella glacialis]|uniref:Uncharacterized protein n=1 Tax=Polarella glacialis TaxID=89957 RepID=A0A813LKB3_POLGL|nr:unnamed protein product [Polarella glacialis]